jgi:superfamily II DNA or RNA helicase
MVTDNYNTLIMNNIEKSTSVTSVTLLRDYQKLAIQAFENRKTKNAMLCMATGSGKTVTFCEIAKRHFAEHITKVLILVHRQELLTQAANALGYRCFKIEKGVKNIPRYYDYYVGMVETVNRRLDKLPDFGLVIIDEAHIGNFNKLPFFDNSEIKVLGVTATPIAKKPLSKYYHNLITPVTIKQLIDRDYLVNCDVYAFASDLVDKAKFKVKRGEFDEKQMQDFYSSPKMVLNVINAYWQKIAGKKTIIFNVNIMHNMAVYNALKSEGLNVYALDGSTPKKEREEIISKFKSQNDAIICNVGVLTAGFDEPAIEAVVLNRATKSLSLYLQMVGRGARIYPNKSKFTVIDLGKNTTRHGFYDHQQDWHKYFYEGSEKEKTGVGAAPTKECPECGYVQHPRVVNCENCDYDFVAEREAQAKEEKEQKLYLLLREKPVNLPLQKLFDIADERNWSPYAVLFKIAEHLVKYQEKHGEDIVTSEYLNSLAIEHLAEWCKKYGKYNNKWNQTFILDAIKKKYEEIRK